MKSGPRAVERFLTFLKRPRQCPGEGGRPDAALFVPCMPASLPSSVLSGLSYRNSVAMEVLKGKRCRRVRQGRLHLWLLEQARENELNFPETKGRWVFKCWGELVEKYRRTLGGKLVYVIRPAVFANLCSWKLSSYLPPHSEITILLADYISREYALVLEKDFPGLSNWAEAGRRFKSQRRTEKNLQFQVF